MGLLFKNDLPKDKAWWKSMLIAMVGCMQLMKGMIDNAVIPLEIQRQRQRQQEQQEQQEQQKQQKQQDQHNQ